MSMHFGLNAKRLLLTVVDEKTVRTLSKTDCIKFKFNRSNDDHIVNLYI